MIGEETCRDLVYFRKRLQVLRKRFDDNIPHRVNSIRSTRSDCDELRSLIEEAHKQRIDEINYCLNIAVGATESRLLRSELAVEEIVQERTWELFDSKCLHIQ